MLESFLITGRETLEASLVVGVVFSYLNRSEQDNYKKTVWYGIAAGILASILVAFLFNALAHDFEGRPEQIFEGTTMLLGAFLLTTMILWMMGQRHVAKEIERKVGIHLQQERFFSHIGIFSLIMVAILREGVETVIFLNALNFASGISFISGLLGVCAAVFLGYLFFIGSKSINLKNLFTVSSILLLFFAAGLVSHGVHEFEEAGIVPGIVDPLFDINPAVVDGHYPLLHEQGIIGSFLAGLFGYNGDPSLTEVIAYLFYLSMMAVFYWRLAPSPVPQV